MAFNLNGGGVGGRRSRGMPAMAEINVTPFVDVALVLLIIFMITAHVVEYGIEVDVPRTKNTTSSVKDLPTINLTETGETYLGKTPVMLLNLGNEIHTRYPGEKAVYVRAGRKTPWDPIAQVLDQLHSAGLQANMVTQPDDSGSKSK